MMEEAIARGRTVDKAKAMAIGQIRKWGASLLSDGAQQEQKTSVAAGRAREAGAIKRIK